MKQRLLLITYIYLLIATALFPQTSYGAGRSINEYDIQNILFEHDTISIKGGTTVSLAIKNTGAEEIRSLEMFYQVEEKESVSEIKTNLVIAPQGSDTLVFLQEIEELPQATYKVKAWVSRINGVVVSPKIKTKELLVTPEIFLPKKPMIEVFTSATCPPCAPTNEWLTPMITDNACVATKYQVNYPGKGDKYFTDQVLLRIMYYMPEGVPAIYVDGKPILPGEDLVQEAINESVNVTEVPIDIKGAFQISGTKISIQVSAMPYISGSYRFYMNVNEKRTVENAVPKEEGGNGETEFFHVLMRMLPADQGSTNYLRVGQPTYLSFEYDLQETNVEEYDDLEVAIFVQQHTSKEVLNAVYATQTPSTCSLRIPNNLSVSTQDGNVTLEWDEPSSTTGLSGYNIYKNGVRIASNISEKRYEDKSIAADIYTYWVAAAYSDAESPYLVSDVIVSPNTLPPTNLKVETTDYKNFTVSWEKPIGDITGYDIYRQGTKINSAPITTTSFTDIVPYEGEYCYTVRAITKDETSPHSKKGCSPAYLPPTPENVVAEQSAKGSLEVRITWNEISSSSIDGYHVYRDGLLITKTALKEPEFTDQVAEFKEYCYMITSVYGADESNKSTPACVILEDNVSIGDKPLSAINIFPNPAHDILNIGSDKQIKRLHIYDISGRMIRSVRNVGNHIKIDDLEKGIYLIQIFTSDDRSSSHKFLKN